MKYKFENGHQLGSWKINHHRKETFRGQGGIKPSCNRNTVKGQGDVSIFLSLQ